MRKAPWSENNCFRYGKVVYDDGDGDEYDDDDDGDDDDDDDP